MATQNEGAAPDRESWRLMLFLSGYNETWDPIANAVRHICNEYLDGHYELDVIDVLQKPDQAQEYDILLTPTLIRTQPLPLVRLSGDLSDAAKLSEMLELKSRTDWNE